MTYHAKFDRKKIKIERARTFDEMSFHHVEYGTEYKCIIIM